jgi:hypothetical protein
VIPPSTIYGSSTVTSLYQSPGHSGQAREKSHLVEKRTLSSSLVLASVDSDYPVAGPSIFQLLFHPYLTLQYHGNHLQQHRESPSIALYPYSLLIRRRWANVRDLIHCLIRNASLGYGVSKRIFHQQEFYCGCLADVILNVLTEHSLQRSIMLCRR